MRLLPTLLLCAFAVGCWQSGSVALAQPAPEPVTPPTLRFLFLDETAGAYSLKLGGDFKRISAAPYTISAPYTPTDFKRLDIYKAAAEPKTGRIEQLHIATLNPPAGMSSAFVIVTPRPAPPDSVGPPSYAVEIIDNGPDAFPAGSIRIINRGRTTMATRLAGRQIVTEPAATRIIAPELTDSRGRLRVLVAVQTPDQWRMIDDSVAIVKPDTRLTGLLVYSPTGMKFRLGPYILAERGDPPPSHVWLTYTDTP